MENEFLSNSCCCVTNKVLHSTIQHFTNAKNTKNTYKKTGVKDLKWACTKWLQLYQKLIQIDTHTDMVDPRPPATD